MMVRSRRSNQRPDTVMQDRIARIDETSCTARPDHTAGSKPAVPAATFHPDERWMRQIARNVTMEGCGALRDCRYLLHDRDTKHTQSFRAIIASGQVEPLVLPARSPNLNAYAERWVRSVKEEGDPLWRAICRALPCRAESPREGQCPTVPSGYEHSPRGTCSMPRPIGWTIALLPSGSGMSGA